MRRLVTLVAAAVAPLAALLLVTAAAPASAGGPTSVLVVNYAGARAAGALTGSDAYADLERALDPYDAPRGEPLPAASFMETQIRLTWLIHDVTPWRVDAVVVDGTDVWVETTMDSGSGTSLFDSPAVRHRPQDADLLLTTLTSLGVLDEVAAADATPTEPSANPPAAQAAIGSGGSSTTATAPTTGNASSSGVPWWVSVTAAVVALALGVVVGGRGRRARRPGRLHERSAAG